MVNDIPYDVIHNILQIAELSIESKIAFKIQKPIKMSEEIRIKLNDLCKKHIFYQDNYKKYNISNIIGWHINDPFIFELTLYNMSTHNEIIINKYKYYNNSRLLDYTKRYNAHTGKLVTF